MPARTPPPPITDPRNPFYRPPANVAVGPGSTTPGAVAAGLLNFSWDVGTKTIEGLPLHSGHSGDCAALQGPMEAIPGEKLEWTYSFPWAGRGDDGRPVPLAQGEVVTFLGFVGGNLRFASANTPSFVVRPPPNITLGKILTLAHIKLTDCSAVILANRIGQPASVRTGSTPGERILVYTSGPKVISYTNQDLVFVTERDVLTGGTKEVLIHVPHEVHADYTPYSFEVHCDATGKVTTVDDHAQGQTMVFR